MSLRRAEAWLEFAKKTIGSAERDVESGDYNWACFKAQQAAEIALKSLLVLIGEHKFTHSILHILDILKKYNIVIDNNISECSRYLDMLYIPTRYPDAWPEGEPTLYYTRADAERAIECAKNIIRKVEEVIKNVK